jgi:DnaJ-class molecular chaperone
MDASTDTVKMQCSGCIGSGFVKYNTTLCEYCDGLKCMFCNSTGYYKMPWDLCETCCGDGEIDVVVTLNNKSK